MINPQRPVNLTRPVATTKQVPVTCKSKGKRTKHFMAQAATMFTSSCCKC